MCRQFLTITNVSELTPDALFPKKIGWFNEKQVTVELIGQNTILCRYLFRLTYDDKIFEFQVLPGTKASTGILCCTKAVVLINGSLHQEHHHAAADKVLVHTLMVFYHLRVRCLPAFDQVDDRERSLSHDLPTSRLRLFTARHTVMIYGLIFLGLIFYYLPK
jgi:hypothetical protein